MMNRELDWQSVEINTRPPIDIKTDDKPVLGDEPIVIIKASEPL